MSSNVRTTFRLLDASHALKRRVDHLATALGGRDKYGIDTPITVEQVRQHNGADDASWVQHSTEVHLPAEGTAQASTEEQAVNESEQAKTVKMTKALQESFQRVLACPDTSISSTVNQGDQLRTTTIKIKTTLGSELESFLTNLEGSQA